VIAVQKCRSPIIIRTFPLIGKDVLETIVRVALCSSIPGTSRFHLLRYLVSPVPFGIEPLSSFFLLSLEKRLSNGLVSEHATYLNCDHVPLARRKDLSIFKRIRSNSAIKP
jgi:hypothetical protein